MEAFALIIAVIFAHAIALISPGPDFFMTVKQSMTYSRKTGTYTAFGIGLGILVHVTYCALGLAIIVTKSILLFNLIKLLGAAYLIFIGIKSFMSKDEKFNISSAKKKKDISRFEAVKIGFLTNALNPKATVYFLSLFTFIISPETPVLLIVLLAAIMVFETIAWFSLVAFFLTQTPIREKYQSMQGIINKMFGGILVALGIKIAISKE